VISGCGKSGLNLYYSLATVNMNHINSNQSGIRFLNSAGSSMTGNMNALDYDGTQEINDNSGIEIYASNNSLPLMRFNAIIDDDNTGAPKDFLLYYDNLPPANGKYDIAYNCWGPYFDPSTDLYANYGILKPYPIWCPGGGGTPNPDVTLAESMYKTAISDVEDEDYVGAKNLLQLIIETYPDSEYASAAMKELMAIEPYAGNDFSSLRNYYLTNDSIVEDTTLQKLGDFLANRCNVQLNNYPDAISWYENKILNPEIETDSIFAIIDLGNLYLQMDTTGNRPVYTGSMPQYKPQSQAKYGKYRDSLISLLPFPKKTDLLGRGLKQLKAGQLLQNTPNPANSSTEIYYKLLDATKATINIYDSWGRMNQQIPVDEISDGVHKTIVNTSNLSPGVYEYSLTVNGQLSDSKRMIVTR
jgi:hypothetical protein